MASVGADGVIQSLTAPVELHDDVPFSEFVFSNDHPDDRTAFINTDDSKVTFGQLKRDINRAMNALKAAGFNQGDLMALHLPNCVQFVVVFHAVSRLGGTVTTSNPMYSGEELGHQLKVTGAKFLISLTMFKDAVSAASEAAGVATTWYIDEGCPVFTGTDDEPCPSAAFDPKEQVLVIPFSSGTSGLPKGVELTHASVVANVCQLTANPAHSLGFGPDDVICTPLPLFHIYGMTVCCSCTLRQGAAVILIAKFDPGQFLTLCAKHHATVLPIVPPIAVFLAKHPVVENFDLSSVKRILSGAAPLGPELSEMLAKRLNAEVFQGYGMTELSPASNIGVLGSPVHGSCGRLLPNTEARLVDPDTGAFVGSAPDQRGELQIRGPQVMKGYFKNPEATAATIDADGFLHTGDIATMDAEGNFFIVDRLKELIKVKGFQVAPAELEALMLDHPKIADVAVIGVADERAGEVPKAFVVRKPDAELTEEEVKAFVADRVAVFKKVVYVEFVDKIEKSASGKILRRKYRAREAEAAAAAAAPAAGDAGAGAGSGAAPSS